MPVMSTMGMMFALLHNVHGYAPETSAGGGGGEWCESLGVWAFQLGKEEEEEKEEEKESWGREVVVFSHPVISFFFFSDELSGSILNTRNCKTSAAFLLPPARTPSSIHILSLLFLSSLPLPAEPSHLEVVESQLDEVPRFCGDAETKRAADEDMPSRTKNLLVPQLTSSSLPDRAPPDLDSSFPLPAAAATAALSPPAPDPAAAAAAAAAPSFSPGT
eukprot:761094-Hanusia_phi.AAC.1